MRPAHYLVLVSLLGVLSLPSFASQTGFSLLDLYICSSTTTNQHYSVMFKKHEGHSDESMATAALINLYQLDYANCIAHQPPLDKDMETVVYETSDNQKALMLAGQSIEEAIKRRINDRQKIDLETLKQSNMEQLYELWELDSNLNRAVFIVPLKIDSNSNSEAIKGSMQTTLLTAVVAWATTGDPLAMVSVGALSSALLILPKTRAWPYVKKAGAPFYFMGEKAAALFYKILAYIPGFGKSKTSENQAAVTGQADSADSPNEMTRESNIGTTQGTLQNGHENAETLTEKAVGIVRSTSQAFLGRGSTESLAENTEPSSSAPSFTIGDEGKKDL